MAQSINQRIVLSGADEVRRHLDEIAAAGQRAGNTTRAALIAATQGATSFTTGARSGAASAGQMRFALQNLSFQVNDVATSLASGSDAMRVFAQQGGQVFQAIQQGGGLGNVLTAAAAGARSLVTPLTAAAGAVVALGAGIGALVVRSEDSRLSAERFDAILKVTGKSSLATGKQLEDAARSFHNLGISTSEARDEMNKFLAQGGDPRRAEQVVRIGAKLRDFFGEDKQQEFLAVAAKGGPALADFAKFLGIIPPIAEDTSKQLEAAAQATTNFNRSVDDLLRGRNRSIADVQRGARQQIGDLTRKRGTPEEEIQLQARRQIEQINRDSDQRLIDLQRQRNQQLADEQAKALAAYNKQISDAAQQALDTGAGLFTQIEQALDRTKPVLNPFQQAIRDVSTAWNDLADTMAKSDFIQSIITGFSQVLGWIKSAITFIDQLSAAIRNIPNLPSWLGGSGAGPSNLGMLPFTGILPWVLGAAGKAEGGPIRGSGTGTSDSVPIWASNGEFMMRAAAVRHWGLGVMEMMNGMSNPIMPRTRFATGGMVAAGAGGGAAVHIHIGNGSFQLRGDQNVVDSLSRTARRQQIASGGRKPSWKS